MRSPGPRAQAVQDSCRVGAAQHTRKQWVVLGKHSTRETVHAHAAGAKHLNHARHEFAQRAYGRRANAQALGKLRAHDHARDQRVGNSVCRQKLGDGLRRRGAHRGLATFGGWPRACALVCGQRFRRDEANRGLDLRAVIGVRPPLQLVSDLKRQQLAVGAKGNAGRPGDVEQPVFKRDSGRRRLVQVVPNQARAA